MTVDADTDNIVRETRYTVTVDRQYAGDPGGSYGVKTKRCALCETPRSEFWQGDLARHLEAECPAANS